MHDDRSCPTYFAINQLRDFCRIFYKFQLFSADGKMLQNLKIVYNLTQLVRKSYCKRFVSLFSVLSHLVTKNKRAVLLSGCRTLMAQTKQRRIKLEENNGGLLLLITVANSNSLCHRSKATRISSSRLEHCHDRFLGHRLGDDLVDWNSGVSVRPSVRPQKVFFPISI